jgi:DNA gyrase/topoisomerase IV subunit B
MADLRAELPNLTNRARRAMKKAKEAEFTDQAKQLALAAKNSDVSQRAVKASIKAAKQANKKELAMLTRRAVKAARKAAKKAKKAEFSKRAIKAAKQAQKELEKAQLGAHAAAGVAAVKHVASDTMASAADQAREIGARAREALPIAS